MQAQQHALHWLPCVHWQRLHGQGLANDPLAELTGEQKWKLQQLQKELQAEGSWSAEKHDFYMLRRFLKARDWDVQKAKQMWQEMLAFRSNNGVDHIFQNFHFKERDEVLACYPHGLHKVDREGRPVLVYRFGAVDLEKLLSITNMNRLTLWHIQEYERIMRAVLPACSVLAGRHIEKIVSVIDVAGVRLTQIKRVLELLSVYIKVDGNNYPETLGAMIIINAPMWFSGSFGLIKGMLSAETQKKVQILGTNYAASLQAVIPRENLLPEFQGTSSGNLGDSIGPWVPVLQRMRAREEAHAQQLALEAEQKQQAAERKLAEAGPQVVVAVHGGVLHPPKGGAAQPLQHQLVGQKHAREEGQDGVQQPPLHGRRSGQLQGPLGPGSGALRSHGSGPLQQPADTGPGPMQGVVGPAQDGAQTHAAHAWPLQSQGSHGLPPLHPQQSHGPHGAHLPQLQAPHGPAAPMHTAPVAHGPMQAAGGGPHGAQLAAAGSGQAAQPLHAAAPGPHQPGHPGPGVQHHGAQPQLLQHTMQQQHAGSSTPIPIPGATSPHIHPAQPHPGGHHMHAAMPATAAHPVTPAAEATTTACASSAGFHTAGEAGGALSPRLSYKEALRSSLKSTPSNQLFPADSGDTPPHGFGAMPAHATPMPSGMTGATHAGTSLDTFMSVNDTDTQGWLSGDLGALSPFQQQALQAGVLSPTGTQAEAASVPVQPALLHTGPQQEGDGVTGAYGAPMHGAAAGHGMEGRAGQVARPHTLQAANHHQQHAGHQQPTRSGSTGSSGDPGVQAVLLTSGYQAGEEGRQSMSGKVLEDDAASVASFESARSMGSLTGTSPAGTAVLPSPGSAMHSSSRRLHHGGSSFRSSRSTRTALAGTMQPSPGDKADLSPGSWQPSQPTLHDDADAEAAAAAVALKAGTTAAGSASSGSMTGRAGAVAAAAASRVYSALAQRLPRWLGGRTTASYQRLEDYQPPAPQLSTRSVGQDGDAGLASPAGHGLAPREGSVLSRGSHPLQGWASAQQDGTEGVGGAGQGTEAHAGHYSLRPQGSLGAASSASGALGGTGKVGMRLSGNGSRASAVRHAAVAAAGSHGGAAAGASPGAVGSGPGSAVASRTASMQKLERPAGVNGLPLDPVAAALPPAGDMEAAYAGGVPPGGVAVPHGSSGRYATQLVPEYVRTWLRTAAVSLKQPVSGSRQQLLDTHDGSMVVDQVGSYDLDGEPVAAAGRQQAVSPDVAVPSWESGRGVDALPGGSVGNQLNHLQAGSTTLGLAREDESEGAPMMSGLMASTSSLSPPGQQAMSPPHGHVVHMHMPWGAQAQQAAAGSTASAPAALLVGQTQGGRAMHVRTRSGGRSMGATAGTIPAGVAAKAPSGTASLGAGPRRLPASYEVYVDSDEEEGGLLHMGGSARPHLLPRYGFLRTLARRLFCCYC